MNVNKDKVGTIIETLLVVTFFIVLLAISFQYRRTKEIFIPLLILGFAYSYRIFTAKREDMTSTISNSASILFCLAFFYYVVNYCPPKKE